MNGINETNLINKIAAGDELAFNEVYSSHRNRIYGFVYRMTFNQTIAEDITHEVFVFLIENPKRFYPERGSVLTFLCAVARNLVMNHLRLRYKSDVAIDEYEDFDVAESETKNNPLSELLKIELAAQIDACVAALPPLQREVIILREYQGLSYEEIANVTGAEKSAVKTRLHRARQTLAGQLSAYVSSPKDKSYELC